MPSLDELEAHLVKLDSDFAEDSRLRGTSFHKTRNNTLGFAGPKDFAVLIPWGPWGPSPPNDPPKDLQYTDKASAKKADSVLQLAFKDVLKHGQTSDKCFIDIAELRDGTTPNFFVEGDLASSDEKLKSVGKAIADVIEALPDDNAKVVIRFLLGDPWKATFDETKDLFHDLFWPKDKNGNRVRLINKKKNATLYAGYYSPNYDLKNHPYPLQVIHQHAKDIHGIANWLEAKMKTKIPSLHALADKVANASNDDILKYLGDKLASLSWNHGKILAVNGRTLMTGGANYWWQNASNMYITIEQQCKIEGDAAVSAHVWQDYFFRYLNKKHITDSQSWMRHINLCQNSPTNWADGPAPMSTDAPFELKVKTTSEKSTVLTTSLLGDWHKGADFDYPVQFVQAFKDLILNIVWCYLADTSWVPSGLIKTAINFLPAINAPIQGVAMVLVEALFAEQQTSRDQFSLLIGHSLTNPYKTLRINPNAWASRMTRLNAIASAKKSVIICQQRFNLQPVSYGNWDHKKRINGFFNMSGAQAWDGYTWPYDLLVALGYALAKDKGKATGSADVHIVLTAKHNDEAATDGGWGDTMHISDLKKKLKMVMQGMASIPDILKLAVGFKGIDDTQANEVKAATVLFSKDVDLIPADQVEKYVDDHVKVGRVLKSTQNKAQLGTIFNHSKIVCVDDQVMYFGSDNVYPSYNEEHGVWIDDEPTIKEWKQQFWDELWTKRTIFPTAGGPEL